MKEHFVVVGGGQAAAQAIQTARQNGYSGRVTLISEEPFLPYQRPPLSKRYLAGELSQERLLLKNESFYASREVDLCLGIRVEALELGKRRVSLSDKRSLSYTHLLLATGSRVRKLGVPGEELAGVNYLRSMADADHIIEDFSTGQRLVIIGAGYIGLEVAAVAIGRGLEVTVIEASERVLSRTVCPTMSRFYADYHRARGVDLHCSAPVARICGRDRVEAVEVADGQRFDADVVIIGIGIVPNVELASQAGLQVANGIRVDECARTLDSSVLAAGDCTSHPHPFVDREIRLESVQNAIEQGKSAALQLTGEDREFSDIPWFWSDQYDLKLQIAGLSLDYDQTVVRGDMDSASFSIYYLRQGKAIAVDSVNNPREFIAAKKLLATKPELPVDMIRDQDADLAALAG